MTSLLPQIIQWGSGVDYELEFWRNWLRDSGGAWPEDFAARLDPDAGLNPAFANELNDGAIVVDVGAGLLSALGTKVEGKTIRVIACDPLMDHYLEILGEYGIKPRTEVRTAFAEDLSASFNANSVDFVHCMNALDHAFDPLRGIEEMLEIVKPGGVVFLAHHRNEAETENYSGFHQWNFDKDGDDFVMWNKTARISIREAVGKYATPTVAFANDGGAVTLSLCKKAEAAAELSAMVNARRQSRLQDAFVVLREVSRQRAALEAAGRDVRAEAEVARQGLLVAHERLAAISAEAASAQAQLAAVLASRSWRLTALVRRAFSIGRS